MKFGLRKPSFKKSFKARTTGKLKRKVKKAINPFYGKRVWDLLKTKNDLLKTRYTKRHLLG